MFGGGELFLGLVLVVWGLASLLHTRGLRAASRDRVDQHASLGNRAPPATPLSLNSGRSGSGMKHEWVWWRVVCGAGLGLLRDS